MRRDLFVYLSGPISARDGVSVEENVAAGLRSFIACIHAGVPAFCPHLTGAFPSAHSEVRYDAWMAYDFAVLARCTHVLMLPHWETSAGAVREKDYAEHLGRPIFYSLEALIRAAEWR